MAKVDPHYLLYRFYGWIWTLVVTLLVLAAVALTVIRLAMPYTEDYRNDLELSLSESLGQKVLVGSMSAELNGLSPTLVLKDLTIYDASGQNIQFNLARMDIGFSLIKSLQDEKAIPNSLNLSGTELRIVRVKKNVYTVNDVPLTLDLKNDISDTYPPVLNWLFENARLTVDQVKLDFQDKLTKRHIELHATEIKLKNSGSRHQIDGVVLLSQGLARRTGFSIDIEATDMHDISSWKTSTFALLQGVDVERINQEFFSPEKLQVKGLASVRLWSTWQGLSPVSFSGDLHVSALQLGAAEESSPFTVAQVDSRFLLQRESPSRWLLDVQQLQLHDKAISREASRIEVAFDTEQETVEAKTNLLYLQDLRKLLMASDFIDQKQHEMLDKLAFSGEIRDVHVNLEKYKSKSPEYNIGFRTKDLSNRAWKKIPRVKGLDAVVWLDEKSGTSLLSSSNMQLDIAHVFRYPWTINSVQGLLQWRKHNGSWHVMSERLAIDGRDADMVARVHLLLGNKQRPAYLDLLARFENIDVTELKRYYPATVIEPSLLSWMDRAFLAGYIQHGGVVFRGSLAKGAFPFRQKQGKFEVDFKTEKLSLNYFEKWPDFHNMQADVTFATAGMRIETKSASVQGLSVKSLSAEIEDFRKPWLLLHGKVQGKTAQALEFVNQSPLGDSLSPQVRRIQAVGKSDIDLSMMIPLSKSLGTTQYKGNVKFKDSRFRLGFGDGALLAKSVNGNLLFTEQGYSSDTITGRMFSRPVSVNVSTKAQADGRVVELALQGRANATDLQKELKIALLDYLHGESRYSARLSVYQDPRKETQLTIDSDMQGMAIKLPKPLYKAPESRKKFSTRWLLNSQRFKLSLGEDIHSSFWLDTTGEKTQLRRGDLHFGPGIPAMPDVDVLRLSGRLEGLPLSKWIKELSQGKSENALSVKIPWEVDLDYLSVLAVEAMDTKVTQEAKPPNPESLPMLRVNIKQLQYKKLNLGRFSLYADPFSSGYKIDSLNFNGPLVDFKSSGFWQHGDKSITNLNISAHAYSSESLLSNLGFDSPMKGGELKLNGNISWPGSPDKFDLKAVEGKMTFNITNGRLLNIEPGAGRVLGLLSFQALPRRLALDFRDLFGQGYHFDSIQGEFNIAGGNAHTRNMTILSTVARVYISGRVGLQARDYDQDVIVVLGDGSNLFVAGALAGGIQVGVIVWVMEKLLDVEKRTQLIYKITGTWDKPVVTSLSEAPD